MKNENRSTILSRNARFLWVAVLCLPPGAAFLAYNLTPHEEIWHEVLYSLICVPLFCVWLVALLACVLSFLIHRCLANAEGVARSQSLNRQPAPTRAGP